MEFWKPSVRKLATTALLVALYLINSVSSAAIDELYKKQMLNLYEQAVEKHPVITSRSPLSDDAYEAVGTFVKSAEYQQFMQMGYIKWAIQAAIGIFLAYFAACLIHRKKKPGHAPEAAANPLNPVP